jgi:Ni,Fe-hydrogenase III component G
MSGIEREEAVAASLVASYDFLEGRVRIQRARRIWVEVEYPRFRVIFDRAADALGFGILCVITGLDEGGEFGVIYHLSDDAGTVLSIHTRVPKTDPRIHSVTERFPSAHIYERELVDLLGIIVEGLPEGNRYPLPDDWPEGEYPLRKDWKPGGADAKAE